MIPFLYFDLKAVIRNFLDIVNQPVFVETYRSGNSLNRLTFQKRGIYYRYRKSTLVLLLRKKLIPLQSLMLSRFKRLTNSEKVQEILSLKRCRSCLKEAS